MTSLKAISRLNGTRWKACSRWTTCSSQVHLPRKLGESFQTHSHKTYLRRNAESSGPAQAHVTFMLVNANTRNCPGMSRIHAWSHAVIENMSHANNHRTVNHTLFKFETTPQMVKRCKAILCFGSTPRKGERILILRKSWLLLILNGHKTLEIRGTRLRAGDVWLGCQSKIYGKAHIGGAIRIKYASRWLQLQCKHLVPAAKPPYKKTWGLPMRNVKHISPPLPFVHPRGAIGIVRFQ